MNLFYRILISAVLSASQLFTFGQVTSVNTLINRLDSLRARLPIEKLYLQTDKPAYLQSDTIWFKAYLVDADFLRPSAESGLLYVELDDIDNNPVKRIMTPLTSGVTWGNIKLDENIPEGSYTLRAYTNWMRNFGELYIFKKSMYIASTAGQSRLVAANFLLTKIAGKDNIRAGISISNLKGQPERLKNMQLRVSDGRHTLIKANASTGVDGKMDVNFDLPENTPVKNLSILARNVTKGDGETPALTIPITINRPGDTDLQFMPEGGTLLAGLQSKVGFKAIADEGKGKEVSGLIYDSKQQVITNFKSAHLGMGVFEFTPKAGETYMARLNLPGGGTKIYLLPAVHSSGTALSVSDNHHSDTLQVTISLTADLAAPLSPGIYYLTGQSRGIICYGARLTIRNATSALFVPKNLFPTGITRISLLNEAQQPLNERICYINHHDDLKVNVLADKTIYAPHDSIALKIQVTDYTGQPVRGSFSIAVTDDSQVKPDSTSNNMVTQMLLTSDLKGTVEQPGYYFNGNADEHARDLDNLMLTQGWIGYEWGQITAPENKPLFAAEPEFTVKGKVSNAFNKPIDGAGVTLLSKKPVFIASATTGKDGRFLFKGFLPGDTAAFVIQARNKHDQSFNVGVTVDEFKPPSFSQSAGRVVPWYVNTDTSLLRNLNNQLKKQQAEITITGGHVLKEVIIKDKKVVRGSKNLNGDEGADEVLDEKDMEKAGKMTLLELIRKKVSHFTETNNTFKIDFNLLHLIIDGINVDDFFIPSHSDTFTIRNERYFFLKSYMDYITAEDIIGIETMFNYSKTIKYNYQFYYELVIKVGDPGYAYVEVTTRSGNGAFMRTTPGIYLYKPLPVSSPKQFYSPKYTLNKNTALLPDLRSTIHWEPKIVTDTTGKATISFYSADKPTNYTITLEGTDFNGRFGFTRRKLEIK